MDERKKEFKEWTVNACMGGWMDGWTNGMTEPMNDCMSECIMNEWTNEYERMKYWSEMMKDMNGIN